MIYKIDYFDNISKFFMGDQSFNRLIDKVIVVPDILTQQLFWKYIE